VNPVPKVQKESQPPARVDSHLIIQFLTAEPPEQAERAARLFEAVDQGAVSLMLEDVVLAEVVLPLGLAASRPG
jgi:hypothetical protein